MLLEAIGECQKELELSARNPWVLASVAYVYARAGQRNEARKIIA
jgi:Flp pilus assembly protein TadD